MKKADFTLFLLFTLIISALIVPASRNAIGNLSGNYPYLMAFIKTSILATIGEMIASRLNTKSYLSKKGLIYRFFIWGVLGMSFVVVFKIFDYGVTSAIEVGLLPKITSGGFLLNLYNAFMISLFMNLIFAPTFMILHRITDSFIDLGEGKINKILNVKGKDVIKAIDWQYFFGFVVIKTIPLFWIPAHTITFLLPSNFRVLFAALLSVALGLILSFKKLYPRRLVK